jgi:REP element-mobilizing transposase RayT
MARPLRIDLANTWYHVMNRGHRGESLFLDEMDRHRFMAAVSELPERFEMGIHAFVLMDNHYHLLVRTGPEANLSDAIRWLNVTYAVKFNWAHGYHGSVFQGRFKTVILQDEQKAMEVARYIHLNPVRIGGLGLSKSDQRKARVLGCENPGEELIRRRLFALQEFRWSSWRIYTGAEARPPWFDWQVIGAGCGGRNRTERMAALKSYTEKPIRQGGLESPWEGLRGGLVLGDEEFAQRLLAGQKTNEQEQTSVRRLRPRISWAELVKMAEKIKGEPWAQWAERHGDWGRDALIYFGIRHGGLRLAEVISETGMKYEAAAQAAKRFERTAVKDPKRKMFLEQLKRRL